MVNKNDYDPFQAYKRAVEGSLQGRVTQYLKAVPSSQAPGALGIFGSVISYSASSKAEHRTCC